jgi:hypothetical protein
MIKAYQQVIEHLCNKLDLSDRQIELMGLYQDLMSAAVDEAVCSAVVEYKMMEQSIKDAISTSKDVTTTEQFMEWIKK